MDVIIGAYYLLKFLNLETAGIAMRNSHLTTTLYDFVRTCMNDRYGMRSWIYVLWAYVLPYDFFGGALGLEPGADGGLRCMDQDGWRRLLLMYTMYTLS
jgi:hypothetical protein